MAITGVILTKNSSRIIEKCVNSVSWCEEIIVIDDNSTDDTVSKAQKLGARVYTRSLGNDFSKQRNFGLEKAKGEWILFVDSDEIVSPSLKDEINRYTNNPINEYDGFLIKREDHLFGKKLRYGETGNIWLLRLANKDAGKWEGKVHENWSIRGKVGKLKNPLNHYPHPTISEFLQKINFYTTLRAEELSNKNVKVAWWDIILYPKGKLLVNYLFKLGFIDGIPGFLSAVIMSFHSFLVRGKLWQLNNK